MDATRTERQTVAGHATSVVVLNCKTSSSKRTNIRRRGMTLLRLLVSGLAGWGRDKLIVRRKVALQVDARDFLFFMVRQPNFPVSMRGSPNFWPWCPYHLTFNSTLYRKAHMDKMDLTRALTALAVSSSRKEEEKKRRQSNCLLRVTVTFCLVPGKAARFSRCRGT